MSAYCYQCAAQNVDGAKFCRGCGAALGSVLAKTGDAAEQVAEGWAKQYSKGLKDASTGAILVIVAFLICVPLALFTPAEVPWVLVWTVFFAWLACWGGISLASGVGEMLEARSMLRLAGSGGGVDSFRDSLQPPHAVAQLGTVPETSDLQPLIPSSSVTENTTKLLQENPPTIIKRSPALPASHSNENQRDDHRLQ